MSGAPRGSPQVSALGSARRIDLLLLASIPTLLLTIAFLPRSVRRSHVFQYTDPTVYTAVTAHFVHFSTDHLLGNLIVYVLVVPVSYVLAVRAGIRTSFVVGVFTTVGSFPIVLSALNLAVPRNAVSFGFSGINMALAGLGVSVLATYAETHVDSLRNGVVGPMMFCYSLSAISLLALPMSRTTLAIAAASVVLAITYTATTAVSVSASESDHRSTSQTRTLFDDGVPAISRRLGRSIETDKPLLAGCLLLACSIGVGFGGDVSNGGQVLNIYAHFLGYALGFLVAYLSKELGVLHQPENANVTGTD